MKTEIIELGRIDEDILKYVVICVKCDDEWLFTRKKRKKTWEIPGGHIEDGESVASAAIRELFEETGIETDKLVPLCDYYAEESHVDFAYGRLFFCNTTEISSPPEEYEMEEARLFKKIPAELTHSQIHQLLFNKAEKYM